MAKAKRIILASTSPFRKKLLSDAGVLFDCEAAIGDEKTISGLAPQLLAAKRAEFKALDVARRMEPDCLVIGADQVLGMDGVSYDKAWSEDEAFARLKDFQGRTHHLHSAICVVAVGHDSNCQTVYEGVVDVPMTMKQLTHTDIRQYVATGEWQGCVGCYRIEGKGRDLFSDVGPDESAIIGLPLKPLLEALIRHNTLNS
jgi:septum formation protein